MTPDKIEVKVVSDGEVYEWQVWMTMHDPHGGVWSEGVWHRGICRTAAMARIEGDTVAVRMRKAREMFR